MPEIHLSRPLTPGGPIETMGRETFDRAVALIRAAADSNLTVKARWTHIPDYLEQAVDRLHAQRVRVAFVIDRETPPELVAAFQQAGFRLVVRFDPEVPEFDPSVFGPLKKLEMLLPLPTTETDLSGLDAAVGSLPGLKIVRLAVGWTDPFSGPEPLDPKQWAGWADFIEQVATTLSERRLDLIAACGLPLCLFSRQALGRLARLRFQWPIATCRPPLAVLPNGDVLGCPRLRPPAVRNVMDIDALGPVTKALDQWLRGFRGLCEFNGFQPCRSLAVRACGGSCLAHFLAGWQSASGSAASGR